MAYFEKKLRELLPPLYLVADESGDLSTFLQVVSPTLDELKDLADRFPALFDVDSCEERFLPYLADLIGYPYDPTLAAGLQRRLIREWVEFNRRRATIPAIRRGLIALGWEGEIEETFRSALRFNRRARWNRQRWPGQIYSLGVYRIISENLVPGLREALRLHHPAGVRVFFWQWVFSLAESGDPDASLFQRVLTTVFGTLEEIFIWNRDRWNGQRHHWTIRNAPTVFQLVTMSETLYPEVQEAWDIFDRYRSRNPNNGTRGFQWNRHYHEGEIGWNDCTYHWADCTDPLGVRARFILEIDTGYPRGHRHPAPLRWNRGTRWNQSGFRRSRPWITWIIPDQMVPISEE